MGDRSTSDAPTAPTDRPTVLLEPADSPVNAMSFADATLVMSAFLVLVGVSGIATVLGSVLADWFDHRHP